MVNVDESNKIWGLFKLPFRQVSSSTSSNCITNNNNNNNAMGVKHSLHYGNPMMSMNTSNTSGSSVSGIDTGSHSTCSNSSSNMSVGSVAKSLLPTRRRLRLDPSSKLYFPYEPGKQVRSAIKIKNTSKSYVAFKFQTTAPKSCFMRPPGAILAPGESLIATVFKFVEHPENNEKPLVEQKSKVKFKIMSLKVKGPMDYVPEMFEEQKDDVAVEQILRVVFLDADRPCAALEKLKRQLADAEADVEARKKPPEDTGPKIIGEGLVIDEWKERRERYLARQQVEGVPDSSA